MTKILNFKKLIALEKNLNSNNVKIALNTLSVAVEIFQTSREKKARQTLENLGLLKDLKDKKINIIMTKILNFKKLIALEKNLNSNNAKIALNTLSVAVEIFQTSKEKKARQTLENLGLLKDLKDKKIQQLNS